MSDQRLKSVVIVGGGTAGWMTAAALAKTLSAQGLKITLVESEAIGTVGVGEATIPPILTFNAMLGLDERAFMRATKASFKLGIEFVDWGAIGETYHHPFGTFGLDLEGVKFHQVWRKFAKQAGPIGDFNLTEAAARRWRFALPDPDPAKVMSSLKYAYHFDAGLYARFLRGFAEARGVMRVEGRIAQVDQHAETGFVEAVVLEDGRRVEGEFFVDCSGFRGLLIGQALKVPYQDWSRWLPNNRAVAIPCELGGDGLTPFTRATAREGGWQWRIPLQHRIGNGYVYSSHHVDDERALDTLLTNLDGRPTDEPNFLRFTPGRRERAWEKNVCSIGLSAGFIEPLESTSIHMIQAGITKLLALFPGHGVDPLEIDEYNRLTAEQVDRIRDFVVLHFHATRRDDTDYWRYLSSMTVPDSLARRMELFAHRGRWFPSDYDLFHEPNWLAVLLGQGITPEEWDPLVDSLPGDQVMQRLAHLSALITRTAEAMPSHADFVARYCGEPAPSGVPA
ncbi:tryptophan halogenase [Caulobacter sp. D4A]|uniref:tryptophan halogenase family protein n=1 Tax=unclassified Caulobacter TaxID=2648921 RepID=UPI000D737C86|nr:MULTISPECIES: tryptophan halogenase family protein [unclassified Caulobacter]PXA90681.1 tryptophan halogenase [Caulobacter sp. D4A]PXA95572.1 tryptophan halogenase [Caulobacter sp. D5]